jgi:AIPR protein
VKEVEQENNFLTRALAAYAIHYLAQAEVDAAATAITDGFNDNGIDAIHYDARERRLYIVQSKWIHSGTGEPENGDVKKFVAGISDLFNLAFDRFNEKVTAKRDVIINALNDPTTRYEAVVVYPSTNKLSVHSVRDLDDLAAEMNDPSEMLTITPFIQADLYRSLTAGISGEPINLEIGLKSWGRIETPHSAIYGQVDGGQISSWWEKHRTRLFAKNLRGVLGDTEVNNEIRDTIDKRSDLFWYFNNGITIVAKKVQKTAVGGGDTAYGTFHCEDVSVVNGAQTVGAIGKYAQSGKETHHKLHAHVRIISLQDSEADFGEAVTKTNNRQNRIENRDFVALDPEQGRIRTELALENIDYHVLREETASRADTAFDLVESTTALSCASGSVSTVVQLKREIGKLWENITKAPYKELFNGSVSGIHVWQCVRAQRVIDQSLDTLVKKLGLNSGRDYGVAIHGHRIIAALVFDELNIKQYENSQVNFEALLKNNTILPLAEKYYTRLRDSVAERYGNAIIPTLFKNLTKCRELVEMCKKLA